MSEYPWRGPHLAAAVTNGLAQGRRASDSTPLLFPRTDPRTVLLFRKLDMVFCFLKGAYVQN